MNTYDFFTIIKTFFIASFMFTKVVSAGELSSAGQEHLSYKILSILADKYYQRFEKQVSFYNKVISSNQELAKYIDRSNLNKKNSK